MREAVEEWKRVRFDERVGAALDERQRRRGLAGQEPFVPEADEAITDGIGFQPDVFGPEFLASAPVAHADGEQDSLTRQHVEEFVRLVVIHGVGLSAAWRRRIPGFLQDLHELVAPEKRQRAEEVRDQMDEHEQEAGDDEQQRGEFKKVHGFLATDETRMEHR